ncbi:hypothetical protein [Janthinobacterium sp. 17J80-10]|uniref:hypothetical protein n=1 Tax=Janthinobacterium sp. 17J80-10 TaxID=2497863 RepID=UPI00100539C6|nr:hypothetical protein [Janthinobacterium sp. 17J80-10]QAU34060.1 hypothetical protein EKL02_07585 [Janthinobacterium sp. 17J80-10]
MLQLNISLLNINVFSLVTTYNKSTNLIAGGSMDTIQQADEPRWRKLEAAKSHTRKVAFTIMGLALTSLFVAITASAA